MAAGFYASDSACAGPTAVEPRQPPARRRGIGAWIFDVYPLPPAERRASRRAAAVDRAGQSQSPSGAPDECGAATRVRNRGLAEPSGVGAWRPHEAGHSTTPLPQTGTAPHRRQRKAVLGTCVMAGTRGVVKEVSASRRPRPVPAGRISAYPKRAEQSQARQHGHRVPPHCEDPDHTHRRRPPPGRWVSERRARLQPASDRPLHKYVPPGTRTCAHPWSEALTERPLPDGPHHESTGVRPRRSRAKPRIWRPPRAGMRNWYFLSVSRTKLACPIPVAADVVEDLHVVEAEFGTRLELVHVEDSCVEAEALPEGHAKNPYSAAVNSAIHGTSSAAFTARTMPPRREPPAHPRTRVPDNRSSATAYHSATGRHQRQPGTATPQRRIPASDGAANTLAASQPACR